MKSIEHTTERPVWTNVVGLARSVVASGTLLTLIVNSSDMLFRPANQTMLDAAGDFLPVRLSLFGLLAPAHLGLARAIAIAVLALVVSGWRPRFTGILHWYVAASFATSCIVIDGGDQIAAVLALLLVPVTLTDGRRWHWDAPPAIGPGVGAQLAAFVSRLMLWTVRLQVAGIYFHASTAKLGVKEWRDGTACYYWFTNSTIGLSPTLERWAMPILSKSAGVVALTWGTLLLEVVLFGALFMERRWRRRLLPLGLAFHAAIIFIHGLVSFFGSMSAALILFLQPVDEPFAWIDALRMRLSRRGPAPQLALVVAPVAAEHAA